jgi:hypothetical protein
MGALSQMYNCALADLLPRSIVLEALKYTKYSCGFKASARNKISRQVINDPFFQVRLGRANSAKIFL